MALTPIDTTHALQIQAGTVGRRAGHDFEDHIAKKINSLKYPFQPYKFGGGHVFSGDPAEILLSYIANHQRIEIIHNASAIATGSLATSEEGKKWLSINGVQVSKCKSDLVINLTDSKNIVSTFGVSTKQCNNKSPTNAQLYFTTARVFSNLLINNGITISDDAVISLRQFCGDAGYRPIDNPKHLANREIDPRRYFWEEVDAKGREEWEAVFSKKQDEISRLLFQKAYMNDPFVPDYLLHKTKKSAKPTEVEVAIYSIDEIIELSRAYQGFATKEYSVRKGSFRDPEGVKHLAPRFGIVQIQRGGQQQHPDQLQFNLEAGYFYRI